MKQSGKAPDEMGDIECWMYLKSTPTYGRMIGGAAMEIAQFFGSFLYPTNHRASQPIPIIHPRVMTPVTASHAHGQSAGRGAVAGLGLAGDFCSVFVEPETSSSMALSRARSCSPHHNV